MLKNYRIRLALFCLSASITGTVAATGWTQGADSWIELTELTLDRENYERSAPDERAAFHVPSEASSAIASVAKTADIDPELGLSARARDQLQIWGPWLSSTGVSDNARQLVNFIERIDQHGLSTNAYGLDLLKSDIASRERSATLAIYKAVQVQDSDEDIEDEGARLERLLNATFKRVATHLGQGTVDPRKTQYRMYRDAPELDLDVLTNQINTGDLDVQNALLSVMPDLSLIHI